MNYIWEEQSSMGNNLIEKILNRVFFFLITIDFLKYLFFNKLPLFNSTNAIMRSLKFLILNFILCICELYPPYLNLIQTGVLSIFRSDAFAVPHTGFSSASPPLSGTRRKVSSPLHFTGFENDFHFQYAEIQSQWKFGRYIFVTFRRRSSVWEEHVTFIPLT